MKAHCSCSGDAPARPSRRGLAALRWFIPGAVLALIPKCPACFAAYLAAATGLGLTLPAAATLRITLIVICTGSLIYLVARKLGFLRSLRKTEP